MINEAVLNYITKYCLSLTAIFLCLVYFVVYFYVAYYLKCTKFNRFYIIPGLFLFVFAFWISAISFSSSIPYTNGWFPMYILFFSCTTTLMGMRFLKRARDKAVGNNISCDKSTP
jgi:hypothetical protein